MLTKYLTVSPAAPGGFKTDARFRRAPTLKPDGAAEPKFKFINRRFVVIETAASLTKNIWKRWGAKPSIFALRPRVFRAGSCRGIWMYLAVRVGSRRACFRVMRFACHACRPLPRECLREAPP